MKAKLPKELGQHGNKPTIIDEVVNLKTNESKIKKFTLDEYADAIVYTELHKQLKKNNKEDYLVVYNKIFSKSYLGQFDPKLAIAIRTRASKFLKKHFEDELEYNWQLRLKKGQSSEKLMEEFSSKDFIKRNLGENISKETMSRLNASLKQFLNEKNSKKKSIAKEINGKRSNFSR